jgi:hypothetical protein
LKAVLLELNEVNFDLLLNATRLYDLPNLKRLVQFSKSETSTKDAYDSGYLEPWVQWVSVHTGVPSEKHLIKHLGDVPNLSDGQIWEVLSQNNVDSGIWGIMNGARRNAKECLFFVADPWTFGEKPYPENLSGFVELAQYIAKNYLNLSPFALLKYGMTYLIFLLRTVGIFELITAGFLFLEGLLRFGPRNMVLGSFFEYSSAIAFAKYKQKYSPSFSILFFNLLAHIQHHYWRLGPENITPQIQYGFKIIDKAIGKVLAQVQPDEIVLVANGLSQINTNEDKPWILYRPYDPDKFLRAIGIEFEKVEALMTHDAHIFFVSVEQKQKAFAALSTASILNEKLFCVEEDPSNLNKLFYRLEFTGEVLSDTNFQINNESYRFLDFFEQVVTRTGKHFPQGFILQSEKIMPDRIYNYEICRYILNYFGIKSDRDINAESEFVQSNY